MIPLLDASPARIKALAEQSGFSDFGQLQTPVTSYSNWGGVFAIDNGGFSRQDPDLFFRFLERRKEHQTGCLWVAVPDVVGRFRRTMEVFQVLAPRVKAEGWPVAVVVQDGAEGQDIPWAEVSAVFVGGSTEWKMSESVVAIIRAAKWLRKKTHVGRINTAGRYEHFAKLGCDTFDGSSLVRPYPGFDAQRAGIAQVRARLTPEDCTVPPADTETGSGEESAISAGCLSGSVSCGNECPFCGSSHPGKCVLS